MGWNLLILFSLFGARALACEPPESLSRKIEYCADNTLAWSSAERCQKELDQAWKEANRAISLGQEEGQKAEFASTSKAYAEALQRLERLIRRTEKAADRLAAYPKAMVDGPGVERSEDSLPCYTAPFLRIETVVQDLDQKAREGRAALAASLALKKRGSARELALAARQAPSAKAAHQAGSSAPLSRKGKGIRRSDISGTENGKEKGTRP